MRRRKKKSLSRKRRKKRKKQQPNDPRDSKRRVRDCSTSNRRLVWTPRVFPEPNLLQDISLPEVENETIFSTMLNILKIRRAVRRKKEKETYEERTKHNQRLKDIIERKLQLMETIIERVELRKYRESDKFDKPIEQIGFDLAKYGKDVENNLTMLHRDVVCKQKEISEESYEQLAEKHKKWCWLFLRHMNSGIQMTLKETFPDQKTFKPTLGVSFFVLFSKLRRILVAAKVRGKSANEQYKYHSQIWYFKTFEDRQMNYDEVLLMQKLRRPGDINHNTTTANNLKHLPECLNLYGDKPIHCYTQGEVIQAINQIIQSQQIEYRIMIEPLTRVHVLYYIEMLLFRVSTFALQVFTKKGVMIDKKKYSIQGGKQTNQRFIEVCMELWHHLLFAHHYTQRWGNLCKVVTGRRLLGNVNMDQEWNISQNILHVHKYFSRLIKKSFFKSKNTINPYFNRIRRDIMLLIVPPGLYHMSQVMDKKTKDIFANTIVNNDKRLMMLEDKLKDTCLFLCYYIKLFSETIDKENTDVCFEVAVNRIMQGFFYDQKLFQDFLNEDEDLRKERELFTAHNRYTLNTNKKFQVQYMYGPQVVQNVIFLNAIKLWFYKSTKKHNFFKDFVVFPHQMNMNPTITIGEDMMARSNRVPIIVGITPMRFDVMYRAKIYYTHHDIRNCIAAWWLMICSHCNGKITIEGEQFNIKRYIPRRFRAMYGFYSSDSNEILMEDDLDSDEEEEEEKEDEFDPEVGYKVPLTREFFNDGSNNKNEVVDSFATNPVNIQGKNYPAEDYVKEGFKMDNELLNRVFTQKLRFAEVNDFVEVRNMNDTITTADVLSERSILFEHPMQTRARIEREKKQQVEKEKRKRRRRRRMKDEDETSSSDNEDEDVGEN